MALPTFISTPNPPYAGITVTLNGLAARRRLARSHWTQVINPGDPVVQLSSPTSGMPTFTAPLVTVAAKPDILTGQVGDGGVVPFSTPVTVSVPVVPPPAGAPPVVAITSNPAISMPSGASGTLTATGVDPAGGTLTFTWVAPAGVVLAPGAADGSVQSFIAPTLPPLSAPCHLPSR